MNQALASNGSIWDLLITWKKEGKHRGFNIDCAVGGDFTVSLDTSQSRISRRFTGEMVTFDNHGVAFAILEMVKLLETVTRGG